MNPAVVFSVAVVAGHWDNHWVKLNQYYLKNIVNKKLKIKKYRIVNEVVSIGK